MATADRVPGRAELERLYFDESMTLAEIARRYDVSAALISRCFVRHGIEIKRTQQGIRPTREKLATDAARANVYDLANVYGVRVRTIRRWFRLYELQE